MAGILTTQTSLLSYRPLNQRLKLASQIKFRVYSEIKENSSSIFISPPPDFKAPQPKRFWIRPDKFLDVLGAALALVFRLGTGALVLGYSVSFVPADDIPSSQYAMGIAGLKMKEGAKLGPRPEKPIMIYEFEGCPYCRKVREMVSVLDLDILFYPCPKNGPTFRPKVLDMGGKLQFPYMVGICPCSFILHNYFDEIDPNTGVSMYESDDIMKYLANSYGDGTIPFMLSLGQFTTLTARYAMIARKGKGTFYAPSKIPPAPLELWAYEASPFCKIVREVLVELELPHILHSVARGSPKRQILYQKAGHFQVPYLEDPNTGIKTFESASIIDYLRATYAL